MTNHDLHSCLNFSPLCRTVPGSEEEQQVQLTGSTHFPYASNLCFPLHWHPETNHFSPVINGSLKSQQVASETFPVS